MSAPTAQAPATAGSAPVAGAWTKVKMVARVVGGKIAQAWSLVIGSILVVVMILRMGVVWPEFCVSTGIASRNKVPRPFWRQKLLGMDDTMQVVRGVPKLGRWKATPYGASVRIKLRTGQSLSSVDDTMSALRHSLRIQSAKVAEIPNQEGFLQLDLLRRDPLGDVKVLPRPLSYTRFEIGKTEYGRKWILDFDEEPHYVYSGATGAGKSGLLLATQYAIAQTDAVLVHWDLKWGLEASVMQPRSSAICVERSDVKSTADQLVHLARERAQLFAYYQVRSIGEFEERAGVHLRRVFLVVDEVAELGLEEAQPLEDDPTADEILTQLLRIVQLVRAMGIHVILCGQRFGSDIGKKITSIRAQITGRVCLRVNDVETARMVLPGLDEDVLKAVMGMRRKGLSVVQDSNAGWFYARPPYLSYDAARHQALAEGYQVIALSDVHTDDRSRVTQLMEGR